MNMKSCEGGTEGLSQEPFCSEIARTGVPQVSHTSDAQENPGMVSGAAEFENFVLENQKRAFSVAYRIVGNGEDARDAVQDAFVKAFSNWGRFRRESSAQTWFHRIVVNASLDILRRTKSRHQDPGEVPEHVQSSDPAPWEEIRRKEIAEKVGSAVAELPDRQREVFVLKHYEELPIREICVLLDLAEGTVKVHLSRAVQRLREELSDYDL